MSKFGNQPQDKAKKGYAKGSDLDATGEHFNEPPSTSISVSKEDSSSVSKTEKPMTKKEIA